MNNLHLFSVKLVVPVFPWRQGSHFLSHITRPDLCTKPDFRPLSPKSLVRLGSLILGSGMAPGRTIKKDINLVEKRLTQVGGVKVES